MSLRSYCRGSANLCCAVRVQDFSASNDNGRSPYNILEWIRVRRHNLDSRTDFARLSSMKTLCISTIWRTSRAPKSKRGEYAVLQSTLDFRDVRLVIRAVSGASPSLTAFHRRARLLTSKKRLETLCSSDSALWNAPLTLDHHRAASTMRDPQGGCALTPQNTPELLIPWSTHESATGEIGRAKVILGAFI